MKFADRADAGNALADRLASSVSERSLVLGIPRGGVVLADIVATRFGADLDIVIPRKLGAPGNEELAIGAVTEDGTEYVNRYLLAALRVPQSYVAEEKAKQVAEIRRRSSTYRKAGLAYDMKGRTAVLVDDGVATGATMIAAARWARKQGPARLVIAVPVAPAQTVEALRHEADDVFVLLAPRDFGAVGEFYEEFGPIEDEQVSAIMRKRGLL